MVPDLPVQLKLNEVGGYFLRPIELLRGYNKDNLRPDLLAGLTVAVILLPQAMAHAIIADLPPQMGLYSAVIASIVGALWGSSNHLQTGTTNAASLLVLSTLLPIAAANTPEYLVAAGMLALLVGIFRLVMGLARMGVLVNFVSDSVIIGFTAGAGVLIAANQLRSLLRLDIPSTPGLIITLRNTLLHVQETHVISLLLGMGVIALIIILRAVNPRLPGPLLGMVAASAVVGIFGLDGQGVSVIGQIPRSLPPFKQLPILDLELIGRLSVGALAVGSFGLVEATSSSRAIASQTGQRLDSNQEFVGQGLANILCGFFSGYVVSGSLTRTAINFKSGGRTSMSSLFSGLFVLISMLILAPLAVYVPRTALAGVLIVIAYRMVDRAEIVRILRGAREDAVIMGVTFLATVLLPLEFAVLAGILISLAIYILRTSTPQVISVLPDREFKHFMHQPNQPDCPQLGIMEILGDLYFGAVSHVEEAIREHQAANPRQRFLLLRMYSVDQCDISGIHVLESIVKTFRERGGDVFIVGVQDSIWDLMKSTGFDRYLGEDHFLPTDGAVSYIFYRILDPAICIYECNVRAFAECQNLPKKLLPEAPGHRTEIPAHDIEGIQPLELWSRLRGQSPPLVVDVREPREYKQGHVPGADLVPLPKLISEGRSFPHDRSVVFVCRGGRRSERAASIFMDKGYHNVTYLLGGMLAWESAELLDALD
jgi:SulP family sulfate permease